MSPPGGARGAGGGAAAMRMLWMLRSLCFGAMCLIGSAPAQGQATWHSEAASLESNTSISARGEAIYQRGQLGDGQPLQARTATGSVLSGRDAACANCHRRSGLGTREGRSTVPPITARYLRSGMVAATAPADLPYVPGLRADRSAYTDALVARALREGLDADGQALRPLMPRFALGDEDMTALMAYLEQLDPRRTPGISDTQLHLATIITPDADPVARRGMLDVLERFVADQNAVRYAAAPMLRPTGRGHAGKSMFRAHRQWLLHVWQLEGAADTWPAQLHRRLAAEPVFAAISGLGGADWAPVQAFCESARLPCLFPNIEAPPPSASNFYSTYFSRGVLLEAELIASAIAATAFALPARGELVQEMPEVQGVQAVQVVQVVRQGDSGEVAAQALQDLARTRGWRVRQVVLPAKADAAQREASLRQALREVDAYAEAEAEATALVLWLRPADLALLARLPVPRAAVFLSGTLAEFERAPLNAVWRQAVRMAQPVDLPERRRVRVDYAFGWFSLRRIAVVAPRIQADTYLACGLLSETLNHSADVTVREYLLEMLEDRVEHRVLTGYYPRLTLGPGQRFGSKGGHLVRFASAEGQRLAPEGEWIVP